MSSPDHAALRPYGWAALSNEETALLGNRLSANIRAARLTAGLTQDLLGAHCHIGPDWILTLEDQQTPSLPRLVSLFAISRATNVSLQDLLKDALPEGVYLCRAALR